MHGLSQTFQKIHQKWTGCGLVFGVNSIYYTHWLLLHGLKQSPKHDDPWWADSNPFADQFWLLGFPALNRKMSLQRPHYNGHTKFKLILHQKKEYDGSPVIRAGNTATIKHCLTKVSGTMALDCELFYLLKVQAFTEEET